MQLQADEDPAGVRQVADDSPHRPGDFLDQGGGGDDLVDLGEMGILEEVKTSIRKRYAGFSSQSFCRLFNARTDFGASPAM